ncbi:hypothetical protein [Phenylobacterium sp.]|uniref:hypothetical protein n=1 Tax=Phenylobacterium sp. TaxID=1871053 RepID=UPI0027323110|nr:hypothetical protein [Phenylobacterium sp.]MDP3661093.1 hypothetical protein [Phenylobacterium sp.]
MADTETRATPWLAFLVGGLLVAVVVIGLVMYSGGGVSAPEAKSVDINLNMPKAPALPDAPKLPDVVPAPK